MVSFKEATFENVLGGLYSGPEQASSFQTPEALQRKLQCLAC